MGGNACCRRQEDCNRSRFGHVPPLRVTNSKAEGSGGAMKEVAESRIRLDRHRNGPYLPSQSTAPDLDPYSTGPSPSRCAFSRTYRNFCVTLAAAVASSIEGTRLQHWPRWTPQPARYGRAGRRDMVEPADFWVRGCRRCPVVDFWRADAQSRRCPRTFAANCRPPLLPQW